jgi:uncharacterized protein (TIGR03437 family)
MPFIAVCAIIMSLGPLFGQGMKFMGLGNMSQPPTTVAPGQIITLLMSNSKTVLPPYSSFQRATTLPLPTSLAGFSVSIRDYTGTHPAAILGIGQSPLCQNNRTSPDCLMTALQIQIPFELTWSVEPPTGVDLIVNDNGTQSEPFMLAARLDNIHVLTSCEISGGGLSNGVWAAFPPCTALVQHADGSLVSSESPAKAGEVVVIYAQGMGRTVPAVKTGDATPVPAPILGGPPPLGAQTVDIQFDFRPNATPSHPYISRLSMAPSPLFVGLTPGQVGLYQINVKLPDTLPPTPACTGIAPSPLISYVQTNLTIDIGGINSFDGAAICVQPPQ